MTRIYPKTKPLSEYNFNIATMRDIPKERRSEIFILTSWGYLNQGEGFWASGKEEGCGHTSLFY
jgi:hypothetical protein